jgi:tetratricopeptide (TPR) repeat protein
LQDDYNNALAAEKRTKDFPKTTYNYVQAAFYWKTIADVTKEEMFYQRALDTYLLAIKKAEKSSVVYTSAGNIYRILKNPSKAEEMYRMALEMTPGEAELYIRLAELYRYDMNKSVDDVLKIYEEGMKKIVAPAPLLISKAAYLRDVGKKDEAMEIFEYLYAETGNEIYHDEIEDIKQS